MASQSSTTQKTALAGWWRAEGGGFCSPPALTEPTKFPTH